MHTMPGALMGYEGSEWAYYGQWAKFDDPIFFKTVKARAESVQLTIVRNWFWRLRTWVHHHLVATVWTLVAFNGTIVCKKICTVINMIVNYKTLNQGMNQTRGKNQ